MAIDNFAFKSPIFIPTNNNWPNIGLNLFGLKFPWTALEIFQGSVMPVSFQILLLLLRDSSSVSRPFHS